MTDRLSIRLTSLALASVVTFSLALGIDALAVPQHASSLPTSQADSTTLTAATAVQPRS
jgi:hypothetical protein